MKKNKMLCFGLLTLGLLFFCNPNLNIIDVLPDCIGCLLIVLALTKLGDLSADIGEAKRAFLTLFWITLSKLPALILLLWITGVNVGEQTMNLVFAFSYGVLETVFALRAFSLLFDGLAYLGTRQPGGEFLYMLPQPKAKPQNKDGNPSRVRQRRFESLFRVTAVFLVAKAALYTLPELTYLSSHDTLGYITADGMALLRFRPLLILFSVVIGLIIGIVWLCHMLRYVRHIAKETAFWNDLYAQYEATVLTRKGIFVMCRVYAFSILASAAAFFSVDFYLDEINVLPDFLSAILFFIAACVIAKDAGSTLWLRVTSVLYGIASALTFATMIVFTNEYYYSDVHKIERAQELYIPYAISNAITQVAFLAVMFSLAALLMRIVRAHTGINTVTGASSSSRPLVQVYAGRIARLRIFSVAAAIMSMLYFYFVVDVKTIQLREDAYATGGYVYFAEFEIAWMVDFAIAMIYAIFTCNLLTDLLSEVRYKYKYE
ncbi:MAG: hypothetical protein IIU58_00505 [Clostridia bacterium]|nr:hypothetical protein [Clostridia bacterium]